MKISRSFMAMGLAAATACLPLFGTSGAILSPMAGSVAVNGQPVSAGSAIVSGDLVSTGAMGSASMVLPGSSVIAASKTNFRMENVNGASQIRLNSGEVKVSGLLPVAVNGATATPASSLTRYSVLSVSGKIYVAAVAGTVAVTSGNKTYTVNAGKTLSFNEANAQTATCTGFGFTPGDVLIVAAAAVGTGIVTYEVTKCSNCVASPSGL